jgi:hypothetical protein
MMFAASLPIPLRLCMLFSQGRWRMRTASTIPLDDRELCPLREAATPSQYTGSLLLDSKIMELAMSFNPIFVILSS